MCLVEKARSAEKRENLHVLLPGPKDRPGDIKTEAACTLIAVSVTVVRQKKTPGGAFRAIVRIHKISSFVQLTVALPRDVAMGFWILPHKDCVYQ